MSISDRFRSRRKPVYVKRMVITALFILCVVFIWYHSMETASLSSIRSGHITKVVNELLSGGGRIIIYENSIRKAAHFLEFALEGWLTVLLFGAYGCPLRRYAAGAVLMGLLTALIDETIQLFSAGRSASVLDVWIDLGGFLFGLLLGILCRCIRKLLGRRKELH